MDLSKAFDTTSHDLLIAKLHVYGFDKTALKLMKSYLSNRWQRTKINSSFRTRAELIIDVPQGSVLGPLLFNIFINDLFFTVVCNYTDDNTLYTSDMKLDILMKKLECSVQGSLDCSVQGSLDCSVQGSLDCSVQGSLECSVQGSLDYTVQGSLDYTVQGSIDCSVQGSLDYTVQGSLDCSVQGSLDYTVQGSSDCSVQGSLDYTVQGSLDYTVQGSLDCSVQGSLDCSVQGSLECSVQGSLECSVQGSLDCSVQGSLDCSVQGSLIWFENNDMKFNSSKCHLLVCGHKYECMLCDVGHSKVIEEHKVKLLGVWIDSDLSFDDHMLQKIKGIISSM